MTVFAQEDEDQGGDHDGEGAPHDLAAGHRALGALGEVESVEVMSDGGQGARSSGDLPATRQCRPRATTVASPSPLLLRSIQALS